MLFCVSEGRGRRRAFQRTVSVVLVMCAVTAGCSADMSPPGDLLSMPEAAPIMRNEPVRPAMASLQNGVSMAQMPVAPVSAKGAKASDDVMMFNDPGLASLPKGPDAPLQNVLAYPAADVDRNLRTSALPEGHVAQPVVSGIGTGAPHLAFDDAPLDTKNPAIVSSLGADRQLAGHNVVEPKQNEQLMAGLVPRFNNPVSKPQWAGGMSVSEKTCRQRLKRLGVVFRDIPEIDGPKGCGIAHPIEVTGFSGGDQACASGKAELSGNGGFCPVGEK